MALGQFLMFISALNIGAGAGVSIMWAAFNCIIGNGFF